MCCSSNNNNSNNNNNWGTMRVSITITIKLLRARGGTHRRQRNSSERRKNRWHSRNCFEEDRMIACLWITMGCWCSQQEMEWLLYWSLSGISGRWRSWTRLKARRKGNRLCFRMNVGRRRIRRLIDRRLIQSIIGRRGFPSRKLRSLIPVSANVNASDNNSNRAMQIFSIGPTRIGESRSTESPVSLVARTQLS